jgi:hypothetical protein
MSLLDKSNLPLFGLSGITCAAISEVNPLGITQLLAMYNRARNKKPTAADFTLSTRNCFRDKLVSYLSVKSALYGSDSTPLSTMSEADIASVGGHVLSAFSASELSDLPKSLAAAVTRQIGLLSMPELMTLVTKDKLKAIAEVALSLTNGSRLTAADLVEMGSLTTASPKMLSLAAPEAIMSYVASFMANSYRRSVCLDEQDRALWSNALQQAYG